MSGSTPEATDLLAGRYTLLEVLGEGGMARVYRAYDRHLRVPRAIKVVHPSLLGRQGRLRLAQEAQLMARLAHPNVVTLFELGEDGDRLFLVMELVEGGSVADWIARHGPLPPKMAARIALGLLSALALAHGQGIVHRDVKPHNILLDRDGTPRVTDFGIARSEEGGLTRTGAVLGTLAYMPPEQKASARRVDARSDLYAAGATLYAMLTAQEPHDLFAAGFDAAVAEELLGALPPPLAGWILRATSFRPDDRFPDAIVMKAALAEIAQALPDDPPAPPPPATRPPPVSLPERSAPAASAQGPAQVSEPTFALGPDLSPRARSDASLSATSSTSSTPRGHWLGYALITVALVGLLVLAVAGVLTASSGALLLAVLPGSAPKEVVQRPVAPAPPPQPAPQRWEVSQGKETLAATLLAERDVVDNTGGRGRPRLLLRCERGKLRGQLETGIEDVDLAGLDPMLAYAAVEIRAEDRVEARMFPRAASSPAVLDLAADRPLVEWLLGAPEVTFTYTSSSMAIVTATFRPRDRALLRAVGRCLR